MNRLKLNCLKIYFIILLGFFSLAGWAQNCEQEISKKSLKVYHKAIKNLAEGKKREAQTSLFQLTKSEPDFAQAFYSLGQIYIKNKPPNVASARKYFEKAIALCPDSVLYAHYFMGKIYYGSKDYKNAIKSFEFFLKDVDKIKTDEEYFEIKNYLEYARVTDKLLSNPVPFKPVKVQGISTNADEYLPIISPDNEFALFTRRTSQYMRRGLTEQMVEKEKFTYSLRNHDGAFEQGWEMDHPFNKVENEGAATLTIDNNDLYYTVCFREEGSKYLNCDLYHSHYSRGYWSPVESLGDHINGPNSWESQPSVTSTGSTIYFASNREGGLGGYDIYRIDKLDDETWSEPKNVGAPINTLGNEKSPFIHTDSQTLYFSSDGHKGVGGYDIFFSRQNTEGNWEEPINIGYPINTFDDDLSFFVSTDGFHGYYASNTLDENNKWNLYSFPLYEKARPQKVLLIKGQIEIEEEDKPVIARIQLENIRTKAIKEIPVDSLTGKYVAAIIFRDDHMITVKKEGYVYSSRFLGTEDTTLNQPKKVDITVKKIEVGKSYKIDDIHFETNSSILSNNAKKIIDEFFTFLYENPNIEVEIQGHTDNVGQDQANLVLSEKRAKSVYTYLVEKGIPMSRLSSNGYGESKPLVSNETFKGRAKNRRTVFVIIKK